MAKKRTNKKASKDTISKDKVKASDDLLDDSILSPEEMRTIDDMNNGLSGGRTPDIPDTGIPDFSSPSMMINASNEDNPVKELKVLMDGKSQIEAKTIINEKQLIMGHKLLTLKKLFETNDEPRCAALVDQFEQKFMTLLISKDGRSRDQYIQAFKDSREIVERARQGALANILGGGARP